MESRRGGVRVSMTNLALIYYSAPSDRGPRKSRADRALAVEELRRGGEVVGFVPSDRMLLPPVDRDCMRRKAGSAAVECELKLLGGGCRKLCIVRRRRERSRASLRSGTSWRRPSVPGSKSGTPASSSSIPRRLSRPET